MEATWMHAAVTAFTNYQFNYISFDTTYL
uniref:Uncharacterized protein n=1 Tax=Rhizophora mucronata TaxID=61149 RepID=A0A2P2PDH2_RHIMU